MTARSVSSRSSAAWEVGDTSSLELHDVGCVADIRQITAHPDGRFDLVTVGRRRFRITGLHSDVAPYLIADVDWLDPIEATPAQRTTATDRDAPDPETDDDALVPGLLEQFQRYLELIRTDGAAAGEQMPDDPTILSYLVAATAILTLDDRQRLLACETTHDRIIAERRLLTRETTLLRHVRAVPVPLSEYSTQPSDN